MKRSWIKVIFALILIVGIEQCCRSQTDGFWLQKTMGCFSYPDQEFLDQSIPNHLLDQAFTFLGSGVQCYAFLGEDMNTVLKLFKHHHAGLSTPTLTALPLPNYLQAWRTRLLEKRSSRMDHIFQSAAIAYRELVDEARLLHLSLSCGQKNYPTVTLYDKIGVKHSLDLNKAPFILQQKMEDLTTYLSLNPESASHVFSSLCHLLSNRYQKGIACTDYRLLQNHAIYDNTVVLMDTGSLCYDPFLKNRTTRKKTLYFDGNAFLSQLMKQQPKLAHSLKPQLIEVISQ